ncbi:MAG: hypothetical protein JXB88_04870 [Spirochaetales bacterium]|nr:hypothetical protein [Spirochaetales bacterium]
MKTFSCVLLLSLLLFTSLYPENNDKPKLVLFSLPYEGMETTEANKIYNKIEENFSESGRFELLPPNKKRTALQEFGIEEKNITRDDALKISRQLDTHFIGLYQLTKKDYYILNVEIIGIGYFTGQNVQFVKYMDDMEAVAYYANEAVDFIIERIFLVEVFFEKNNIFLIGGKTKRQLKQKERPLITTDNFFISRKFFLSLNIAYNIPLAQYDILDPFLYLDLFFDYSLFNIYFLVFSPYIEINYFQHTAYISATTQNVLGCIGFSGGLCVSATFSAYRPLSLHLNIGCGLEASSINWEQPVSIDFMATSTLEARYTFFEELSTSIFLSYLFINYMEPALHEIKVGTSIGYRF